MNKTRVIYKYNLNPGVSVLPLPREAEVLCVQAQFANVVLWAKVDPGRDTEKRRFFTVPTGAEFSVAGRTRYVGTVQVDGLVFHTFEMLS